MSGTPPPFDPRRGNAPGDEPTEPKWPPIVPNAPGRGNAPGDEPTEPKVPLTAGWPALPPAQPGELALPPGHPEELALPAATPFLLLPAPGGTSTSSSQTGTTASAPPISLEELPALPGGNPWRKSHRWAMLILVVSLALLVICALPLWAFGGWLAWEGASHAPPPVVATLNTGGRGASDVEWSPDGAYLAEQVTVGSLKVDATQGSAVVLWDVQARREVRRFTGATGGLAAAWSPDGKWLATTNGTQTLIWSAQEVEAIGGDVTPAATLNAPDKNEAISGLAWAKDGQTLAVVDEGGLDLWQPTSETSWKQIKYVADGPCATIVCGRRVSWSPDGQWLLAAPWHGADGASGVGVWAAGTWEQQPLLKAAAALAWSPDGSLALVRNEDETTLSAIRAGSWTVAWTLDPNASLHQSYRAFPQAAGWSPNGRWLVGSADGWVNLWPTDTRKSAWVWEEQAQDQGIYTATSLAWSPDGRRLAVTTDGVARVTLYDLSNPSPPVSGPPLF